MSKTKGFTLIELTITISVFSILVIFGLNSFMYFFNSWTRTQVEFDQMNEAKSALTMLERDVRVAARPSFLVPGLIIAGNQLTIHQGSESLGFNDILYRVSNNGTNITFERAQVSHGTAVLEENWNVLINGVESIPTLSYFELSGNSLKVNFKIMHRTGNAIEPLEFRNQYTIRSKGVMP